MENGLAGEECMELPPGFRFHPTDEEVISHYLMEKMMDNNFNPAPIGEVDLNQCEPWDLPGKAKMGEKEYYFFCKKGKKYPTGMRTNRATKAGYWKATGKDKKIQRGKNYLVGTKKTLVFYTGRAPKGANTNWVMHEFRLEGPSTNHLITKDEWVVCKVFYKGPPSDQTNPQVAPNVVDQHALQNGLEVSTTTFYGGNHQYYMGTSSTNMPLMENQQYPHQFAPPQFVPTPARFPNPTHLHQSGDMHGLTVDPNPMWQLKEEQYPEQPIVFSATSIMTRNQSLEDFQYLLASPSYPTLDDNNFFC